MRPILFCLALLITSPALACGPDTDCVIGDRTYRLYVPDGIAGPMGALVYAHGYRGSASGAMRNAGLRALADDLGMALIALKSADDDWDLAHRPNAPDQPEAREYDYVAAVIDDVALQIDLDRARLIATGFSAGGMMTWTMACGMSGTFAGFVPMSGTFWAPVPGTCSTPPASIVHIHGTDDGVVPMGGRAIGPTRQGDVPTALAMYRDFGQFTETGTVTAPGGMTCIQSDNADGRVLDLCTFPGGHDFSTVRMRHAIARIFDR